MDLGINLWVWGAPITDSVVAERVPQAAKLGYDAVEFPLEEIDAFDHGAAARRCRENGMATSVAAVLTEDRDLLHADHAVRENAREYLRSCIKCADRLGANRVVGPLYTATGRTWHLSAKERTKVIEDLAEQFRPLGEYAAARGISLCLEPLNRFETSVFNTVDQTQRLIDAIDHPAYTLLVDTFHLNIEEQSIPGAIRDAGDGVGHVHACANHRGAPGTGHIPWEDVAEALSDVGYDDLVVVESFTPDVESIARAASIWRPLAADQDTLARDGFACLSDHF
jgi:D-psicose/D-tagatose/L-ribulose 3-epimerase